MSIPGFNAQASLARSTSRFARLRATDIPLSTIVPQGLDCFFFRFCHGPHLYLYVECEGAGDNVYLVAPFGCWNLKADRPLNWHSQSWLQPRG